MAEITKVKWNGERVEVHGVETLENGDRKELVLRSGDDPAPQFKKAFTMLVEPFREIVELVAAQWVNRIRITGVTFSPARGEEGDAAVLTSSIELTQHRAPLSMNSPQLPFSAFGKSEKHLRTLQAEAEAYLEGKRAQMTFEEAPPVDVSTPFDEPSESNGKIRKRSRRQGGGGEYGEVARHVAEKP
jgi:hypothetical protein